MENQKKNRSGGHCCSVVGCSNNSRKLSKWKLEECSIHKGEIHSDCACLIPYSFHAFPRNAEQRRQWEITVNRKDFIPKTSSKVCSVHFVDGRPTSINPIPAVNMGYSKKIQKGRRPVIRMESQPPKKRIRLDSTHNVSSLPENTNTSMEQYCNGDTIEINNSTTRQLTQMQQKVHLMVDAATQSEATLPHRCLRICTDVRVSATQTQPCQPKMENKGIRADFPDMTYAKLPEKKVLFYTGLSKQIMDSLILLMMSVDVLVKCKLSIPDQILLVLMRLRLGLFVEDLADRFHIATWQASQLYKKWIFALQSKIGMNVCWLPKETIQACMPSKCKEQQPRTTCVIDCSEIFIQRPKRLRARGQTYSNYKSHNTVKFLVAIAPHGYVMYVSPCYGGRASDKFITMDSGFLNMLEPGDEVMADRGFRIGFELAIRGVTLNIPAFTAGKNQFSEQEVTGTRRIASSRIHVERLIKRMKEYNIINTVLPIRSIPLIDATVCVIAALVNMKPPLVKL